MVVTKLDEYLSETKERQSKWESHDGYNPFLDEAIYSVEKLLAMVELLKHSSQAVVDWVNTPYIREQNPHHPVVVLEDMLKRCEELAGE